MNDFFIFIEKNLEIPLKREKFIFPFLTATLDREFDGLFSRKWVELQEESPSQQKKEEAKQSVAKKNFKSDPKDYCFNNIKGYSLIKKPGSIHGLDFYLHHLKDCCFRIFDKTSYVVASKLKKCELFIGPVKGLFSLRKSKQCIITVACEKLYLTDCKNVILYLNCSKEPKFTRCKNIFLAPYNLAYPGLKRQVKEQEMDVSENAWASMSGISRLPLKDFQSVEYTEGLESDEEVVNHFPITSLYRPMSSIGNATPLDIVKCNGLRHEKIIPGVIDHQVPLNYFGKKYTSKNKFDHIEGYTTAINLFQLPSSTQPKLQPEKARNDCCCIF